MNNQQINDPSLTSIQNELIGEDSSNENKSSIKENVILIFLCLILFLFFFGVYYKWMSIPIKRHFIQVEYIASTKESANIRASVELISYKDLDIEDTQNHKKELHGIMYNFVSDNKANIAKPRNKCEGSLSEILEPNLYKELEDTCRNLNVDMSSCIFNDMFYLRYFNNEKPLLRKLHNVSIVDTTLVSNKYVFHIVTTIDTLHNVAKTDTIAYPTLIKNRFTEIAYAATNDFTTFNRSKDSKQKIIPQTLSKKSLSKQGYRNMFEAFCLQNFEDLSYHPTIPVKVDFRYSNKLLTLLWKSIQLEDITQSYYTIDLYTHSITDVSLKMDFSGTVDVIPDISIIDDMYKYSSYYNKSSFYSKDSIFHSDREAIRYDYYKGISENAIYSNQKDSTRFYFERNSLFIRSSYNTNKPDHNTKLKFLVKFNDMENIQTMRLFILAAFITLTLTTMIKSLWKIFLGLGIKKNFKSLWKKAVAGTTKFKKKMIRSRKKQSNKSPSK